MSDAFIYNGCAGRAGQFQSAQPPTVFADPPCESALNAIEGELKLLECAISCHRARICTVLRETAGTENAACDPPISQSGLHRRLLAINEELRTWRRAIESTTEQVTL